MKIKRYFVFALKTTYYTALDIAAQLRLTCWSRQVLWLFGDEHYVTEVGAMNIFFLMKKERGRGVELVTCSLDDGDILDGGRANVIPVDIILAT